MDTSVTHQQETKTASAILDTAPPAAPLTTRRASEPELDTRRAAPREDASARLPYRHSESFGRLMMALAQAQGEFSAVEKTLTAKVESRRDGARSYSYDYADLAIVLDAVRPALSKHGLAIVQMPTVRANDKSRVVIVTTMLAHGESEQWLASDLAVAVDSLDPQAIGSATTYAKRYGLTALLGIAAGEPDDDGRSASGGRKQQSDAPPAGFETWWHDMDACADNGTAAFDEAWQKSNGAFKTHVVKHHREQLNAVKAKAAKVGKATK